MGCGLKAAAWTSKGDSAMLAWPVGVGTDLPISPSLEADDPFDDFDEDDFDDDFDDDFEENWEDDLPEDEEFPDTFGGHEEEEKKKKDSPFKDDPDFDK